MTAITYIGVTGLTERAQMETLLASVGNMPGPRIMCGILASRKTLHGGVHEFPARHADPARIMDIPVASERALTLVHYATDEPDTLGDQLIALTRMVDSVALHGFQLNVPWPDPRELEKFYGQCGRWHMVLQIGAAAMVEADHDPTKIAKHLGHYGGLIDGVLFDASGGRGIPLDANAFRPFVSETLLRQPMLGIGVAGGLGPRTLHLAEPLLREFVDLSTDAESALHDPVTGMFDLAAAEDHVQLSLLQWEAINATRGI